MYKGTFSMISFNVYSKNMYKDLLKYMFFFYVYSKGFSIICFLKYICKRSQEICTNFKVKFFQIFFQKYVQSAFSLIFQKHPKIFLFFTQKVFDIESGVPCKTEFIGCYSFLTNLIKLKHMHTKIITSFLFRDCLLYTSPSPRD